MFTFNDKIFLQKYVSDNGLYGRPGAVIAKDGNETTIKFEDTFSPINVANNLLPELGMWCNIEGVTRMENTITVEAKPLTEVTPVNLDGTRIAILDPDCKHLIRSLKKGRNISCVIMPKESKVSLLFTKEEEFSVAVTIKKFDNTTVLHAGVVPDKDDSEYDYYVQVGIYKVDEEEDVNLEERIGIYEYNRIVLDTEGNLFIVPNYKLVQLRPN
jgi:hypothetical protein